MCVAMVVLAIFDIEGWNTPLVVMMMVFLASYQFTLGTYTWVYLGAVTCEEALSLGTGCIWGGVVIISLVTPTLMDKLQTSGTFFLFAGGSLLSCIFFYFMLRETKGLTRDEAQVVYTKPKGWTPVSQENDNSPMQRGKI